MSFSFATAWLLRVPFPSANVSNKRRFLLFLARMSMSWLTHTCPRPSTNMMASSYSVTTTVKIKETFFSSFALWLPRKLPTELRVCLSFSGVKEKKERGVSRDAKVACELKNRETWLLSACVLWNANDLRPQGNHEKLKRAILYPKLNQGCLFLHCRRPVPSTGKALCALFCLSCLNLRAKGSYLAATIWTISNIPDRNHGNPCYLLGYFSLLSQRKTAC